MNKEVEKSKFFFDIVKKTNKLDSKLTNVNINNIVIDSKKIKNGDLFVAIRGGNNYIEEAVDKGALVVYDKKEADNYLCNLKKEKIFYVEDSIKFLQLFAEQWRKLNKAKVIAITGSNGKTTVKDIVYSLLSSKYKGKKTEGNYNNHIGLPLTLLRLEKDDEFIVLEMGMSDFGEIDLLSKLSNPDISIITNIGESHLEFLETKENVFKAKTEVIKHTKDKIIINYDDEYLKKLNLNNLEMIRVQQKKIQNTDDLKENIFNYELVDMNEQHTIFKIEYKEEDVVKSEIFETNLIGIHNILNASIAFVVAIDMNIEKKLIKKVYKDLSITPMRFQKIEKEGLLFINDAYNASPLSMEKSLITFNNIYNDKKKIVVLADMLELGDKEKEYHENLYEIIKNSSFDLVYLFGERMKFLYQKYLNEQNRKKIIKSEIHYFDEKNDIKKLINSIEKTEYVVLLKGSRGMKLEDIIN